MNERIAVVGIGCIFPDAPDFTQYWKNIVEKKNSVKDISGKFWEKRIFTIPICLPRTSFIQQQAQV